MTVLGWTMTRADRQPFQMRDSQDQRIRSPLRSFGRLTDRWSTAIWCRRARFSAASAVAPAQRPRRNRNSARKMLISPFLARLRGTPYPQAGFETRNVSPCKIRATRFSGGTGGRGRGRRGKPGRDSLRPQCFGWGWLWEHPAGRCDHVAPTTEPLKGPIAKSQPCPIPLIRR